MKRLVYCQKPPKPGEMVIWWCRNCCGRDMHGAENPCATGVVVGVAEVRGFINVTVTDPVRARCHVMTREDRTRATPEWQLLLSGTGAITWRRVVEVEDAI